MRLPTAKKFYTVPCRSAKCMMKHIISCRSYFEQEQKISRPETRAKVKKNPNLMPSYNFSMTRKQLCCYSEHACCPQSKHIIKPGFCVKAKVSVQGVVALGGHFATLCQVDFYEAICGQIKNILLTCKGKIHIYLLIKTWFCVHLCVLSCFLCVIHRLSERENHK